MFVVLHPSGDSSYDTSVGVETIWLRMTEVPGINWRGERIMLNKATSRSESARSQIRASYNTPVAI